MSSEITVLDRRRHVVLSSSGNHQPLQDFDRPQGGESRHLADGSYLWIPRPG